MGAGLTVRAAYLWPSFSNGFSLYDRLLTPAQLELSQQMLVWWGAFTRYHAPLAAGQPRWPPYTSGQLMSLRPGGQSQTIARGDLRGRAPVRVLELTLTGTRRPRR